MNEIKRSLWNRFVTIAQPYFFPNIRGGSWYMLLLLLMLLIFLFGVLFMIVAGITLAGSLFAPSLTAKVASGLLSLIQNIFHTNAWMIVAGTLIIPAACFMLFAPHLHTRKRVWTLLAIVLLLSFSVTGINVAFSYIGNYFTNALVKKNQDMAYLFRCRVFLRLPGRNSYRCVIQLRTELSGNAVARMDDRGVSQ